MKFLIIDDDVDYRKLTLRHLQKEFHDTVLVEIANHKEFDEAVERWDFDAVITDLDNPWLSGSEVCRHIRNRDPYLPVIMLTASGNEEAAVDGMKSGLSDYVTKKHLVRLPVAIRESMEKARVRREYDRTNEILKSTIELFHTFMDNSPALSFIKEENGRYVYASKPFLHFFRTTTGVIYGKTDFDLWPQVIAKRLHENDTAALTANTATELYETVFTSSNIPRYWQVFRFPIKDASGKRHLGCVAIDVTEHFLMETRQSVHFAITNILTESETLRDSAPKLLQTVCEGLGWELGELWTVDATGKQLRLETLWHAPSLDASEFEKDSRAFTFPMGNGLPGRVWSNGQPSWITDVVMDKDFPRSSLAAKIGLHGAVAFPIQKKNEVIGVMVFFKRDIFQLDNDLIINMSDVCRRISAFINRKTAEEQLKTSEHKYRILVENLPQRVFHKDKDFLYVSCTENYARDLNIRPDEIAGKTDFDFFPRKLAEKYYADDKRVIESGQTLEVENKFIKNEIELIVNTVKTTIKDEKNNVVGILGLFWDITDRKRLEEEQAKLREQLYHSQKLEAVGKLAGGVAHSFNNLLTVIIGYGNLLFMEEKGDQVVKDYMQKILNAAERAANLTQGLLAFSRKQPSNPQPTTVNEIVRESKSLLSRILRENIRIVTTLIDKDCIVAVDRSQMGQVLMNLANNAQDAMPAAGLLCINTNIVEMNEAFIREHGYGKHGIYALISVSDTGIGMDKQTKDRVFEPFFTTKEVGKGTGLGLAIAYGIIKQHQGYINVDSEPGQGTTFTIYLPVIESEVEKLKKEVIDAPKGGTETILIAEDEEDVRKLVKLVLEGYGYTVIEAVDGRDAINKFSEHKERIQCLLLDVIMPNKSGKDAYDAIKGMKPGIKTLFMSGYGGGVVNKEQFLAEGLAFIPKPVSPRELLRKIRIVLDG